MKVLLVGGTGVISSAVLRRLVAAGHTPVVVSRGNRAPVEAGVEMIVADKSNGPAFVAQMRQLRFDAVIDMISFNAADVKTTIEAFADRVQQLVVCSTIAAYKRPYASIPTREDAEVLWEDPAFGYAFNKAELERTIGAAVKERGAPITIIRPSLSFGIGAANIGVLRQNVGIIDRIRRGRPLVMFGDGHHAFSFTFVPDLARAFVGVLGNSATFGQAYHATSEFRTTWTDFYQTFASIAGKELRLAHLPSAALAEADPTLFGHLNWEKSYDGLFDNSKIRAVVPDFNSTVTLKEGLGEIVQWWESSGAKPDPAKEALEEALVAESEQLRARLKAVCAPRGRG